MKLLLLILVVATAAAAPAAPVKVDGGQTSFKVPFRLIDNRVFVEVKVNGQGPFHFILDTGASGTIMRPAAQRLGLKIVNESQQRGVGEKTVASGETHLNELQIGDAHFYDLDIGVLSDDDSAEVFGTQPLDGIIGLEVFQELVAKHDYIHKELTFTLPEKFNYRGSGSVVPFERPRQIPVIEAELDGVRGKFGVDTGARSAMLLYGPWTDSNHLRQKYNPKLEGVTGWGIGGPVRSQLARAQSLKFGETSVQDIVIRLSLQKSGLTTSSSMAGLIGPGVLSQFDVTFDYARKRIIFEKNSEYGRHDSWERAGMWLGQEGDHFHVVDVIAGSPAAQAGIKTGDVVTSIDGEKASSYFLPDFRDSLRKLPAGTRMIFQISSGGKARDVTIVLRDLV
ncbi:MAG: aspartyl protease family protein [Terriglobales bacterium]